MMKSKRDILIVGCGIFGTATAWALAKRGMGERVLLVDRQTPSSGATARAAGLVTQVRQDTALQALAGETLAAIGVLESVHGEDVGRRAVGAVHVAPQSERAKLDSLLQHCAQSGIAGQWLEKEVVLRRSPWLASHAFTDSAFFPDECCVDPYLLSSAYLRVAQQLGVATRLNSNVVRIAQHNDTVTGVELQDGTFLPTSIVINAAGAWSNLLSYPVGLPLPMAPVRSQYWITEAASEFLPDGPIVFMPEIRAYARPQSGGLLFGARESAPAVADPRCLPENLDGFVFDASDPEGWENLALAAESLGLYLPSINRLGMAHYITGPSNYTPDSQPIVGASHGVRGLYVASGCNGSGITYSAGVGRLLAELVSNESPFVDATRMDPNRTPRLDPFAKTFLQTCADARANKSTG
jgi:4-methylaminobutanoate oxidase (formaldehyde-forming)